MKNIGSFYLNIFLFWYVKFSIYLNGHVFVMVLSPENRRWFRCLFAPVMALWLLAAGLILMLCTVSCLIVVFIGSCLEVHYENTPIQIY